MAKQSKAARSAAARAGKILSGRTATNLITFGALHAVADEVIPNFPQGWGAYRGPVVETVLGVVPGNRDMLTAGAKRTISVGLRQFVLPRLKGLLSGGAAPAGNGRNGFNSLTAREFA